MEKYLEILEDKIWQSDAFDNKIHDLLCCELQKCNIIMAAASESYNNDQSEVRLDSTMEFEWKYKEKVLSLLLLIEKS